MSIPMVAVTVKLHPDDVPKLKAQTDARGFEGQSEYIRHLILQDRDVLHKQWEALNPIFGNQDAESKGYAVLHGGTP